MEIGHRNKIPHHLCISYENATSCKNFKAYKVRAWLCTTFPTIHIVSSTGDYVVPQFAHITLNKLGTVACVVCTDHQDKKAEMKQFVGCTQIMEYGKSAKQLATIQHFLGCKVSKPVRTTAQDTLSTLIKASQLCSCA